MESTDSHGLSGRKPRLLPTKSASRGSPLGDVFSTGERRSISSPLHVSRLPSDTVSSSSSSLQIDNMLQNLDLSQCKSKRRTSIAVTPSPVHQPNLSRTNSMGRSPSHHAIYRNVPGSPPGMCSDPLLRVCPQMSPSQSAFNAPCL